MKVEIEVPDGITQFLKQVIGWSAERIHRYIEKQVQYGFGSDWDAFCYVPSWLLRNKREGV